MESSNRIAHIGVLEHVLHHHLTHAFQGLLPPAVNVEKLKRVLDTHCRIGAWAIDLALAHPEVYVTGLDSNAQLIELARQNAEAAHSSRVRFYEDIASKQLRFSEDTFDLVHTFLPFPPPLPSKEWSPFLLQCKTYLKREGYINLVSLSARLSSSTAHQRLLMLIEQIQHGPGYPIAHRVETASPGVHFCRLLRAANFEDITYLIRPVNFGGWDNPSGRACCQLFLNDMKRRKHLFLEYDLVSSKEFDVLVAQFQRDLASSNFCATGALISAIAIKR